MAAFEELLKDNPDMADQPMGRPHGGDARQGASVYHPMKIGAALRVRESLCDPDYRGHPGAGGFFTTT
jgi:hypothetical protein